MQQFRGGRRTADQQAAQAVADDARGCFQQIVQHCRHHGRHAQRSTRQLGRDPLRVESRQQPYRCPGAQRAQQDRQSADVIQRHAAQPLVAGVQAQPPACGADAGVELRQRQRHRLGFGAASGGQDDACNGVRIARLESRPRSVRSAFGTLACVDQGAVRRRGFLSDLK